jgi:hypothetical protein
MNHIVIYTTPNGALQIAEGKLPSSWSYVMDHPNVVALHLDNKTFKLLTEGNAKQLLKD